MLDNKKILEFFESEGLAEVDEIDYKPQIKVYNFFYKFDEPEIQAAKSYANENCNKEKNEHQWYEEFFLPFLMELAADNISDLLDDMCDEMGIAGEFTVYEIDKNSYFNCEFLLALAEEDVEFEIEEILDEIDI